VNLDLAALRRTAAALDQHATALPATPGAAPIPADCPLAGRGHDPYLAAADACDAAIRSLRAALTHASADLASAAGRTEQADADAAADFDRLR
jgi:hypothetical protein